MRLRADEPILVRGQVSLEGDDEAQIAKLRAESITLLTDARVERTQRIEMTLPARLVESARLDRLRAVLGEHPGVIPTRLVVLLENGALTQIDLPPSLAVKPSDELAIKVDRIFDGERVVSFG